MADSGYVQLEVVYSGGMIVLSWLVAVIGSWTTLEILLRRTGNAGAMNVMLLLGGGTAFGSTATFGMHFVGNQAVNLRLPPPWEGQGVPLSYQAGYTILSLIVSCLSMILAFSFIGLRLNAPTAKLPNEEDELAMVDSLEDVPDETEYAGQGRTDDKSRPKTSSTSNSLPPPSSFSRSASQRRKEASSTVKEQDPRGTKEEDDEIRDDGGDFGVHAAKVSKAGVAKILGAGVICGGGIAAMHYVGQVSINSVPRITNDWYTVLASILIAMSAVSVGLYILFVVFRPKLQHSWYKRLAVAMILGAGVTAMHFVALVGTHYYAKEGTELATPSDNATKKIIISIICVVAPVCCISLLIFAYFAQLRHTRQRAARHRIILATAIFDHQGLLLVHPESGLLPSARMYPTSTPEDKPSFLSFFGFNQRLRLDSSRIKLSRSDPAFVAFLQLSWSWRGRRAQEKPTTSEEREGPSVDYSTSSGNIEVGFESDEAAAEKPELSQSEAELKRRSLVSFRMASEDIAMQLSGDGEDLRSLGVLYDSILKTGHYEVSSKTSNDKFTVTQGQMLVLARRLKTATERDNFLARGFVFAEPGAVARLTSNSLACPYDRVFDYFRDVYRFTRFGVMKKLERGRLYGGILLLQAIPGEGLQVVVDEKQHHSLPMTELASLCDPSLALPRLASTGHATTTLASVIDDLQLVGGRSLRELSTLQPNADSTNDQLGSLVSKILLPYLTRSLSPDAISSLSDRLILEPSLIPLTSRSGSPYGSDGLAKDSFLLCFKAIVPSSMVVPGRLLPWIPFPLHLAQSELVAQVPASSSASRPGTAHSATSSVSPVDRRSRIGRERTESNLPFPLSVASPFSSSAFPPPSSHQHLPSPPSIASPIDHYHEENLPSYSRDWIVNLVRTTVSQQNEGWRNRGANSSQSKGGVR